MLASRRAPNLGAPTDSVLLDITTAPICLDSAQVLGKATVRALLRALVCKSLGGYLSARKSSSWARTGLDWLWDLASTKYCTSYQYTGGDSMMTAGEKRNACGGLKLSCHNITPERAKSTKWSWHES